MSDNKNSAISAIHHLRMAKEFYLDFIRQYKGSIGANIFKNYIKKIDFIFTDIKSNIHFNQSIRDGIRKELECDIFQIPAINEKISILTPNQRELIEATIDAMLAGEEIQIVDIKDK